MSPPELPLVNSEPRDLSNRKPKKESHTIQLNDTLSEFLSFNCINISLGTTDIHHSHVLHNTEAIDTPDSELELA